jgi:hypothetical protein
MANKIGCDASEVLNNLGNFIADLPTKLAEKMEQATLYIEAESKKDAPVGDTGMLRASIGHYVEVNGAKAEGFVGSGLAYSPFVHNGSGEFAIDGNGRKGGWCYKDLKGQWHFTMGQKPQPFIQDNIDENVNKLKDFFRGLIE